MYPQLQTHKPQLSSQLRLVGINSQYKPWYEIYESVLDVWEERQDLALSERDLALQEVR